MPIAIGVVAAFSWHLLGGDSVYSVALYVALLIFGVIASTVPNDRKPFKAACFVIIGVIIGTVVDIIAFPTMSGFERNLFPIEIALAGIVSAIVTCVTAFLMQIYWKLTNDT